MLRTIKFYSSEDDELKVLLFLKVALFLLVNVFWTHVSPKILLLFFVFAAIFYFVVC